MNLSDDQRLAMYTPQEIGRAIKKRRRELKITQKEFAKRLNKSERTIQKYESGEIIIKTGIIKLIADELDIPWQELLEAKPEPTDTAEDNTPDYSFSTMSDVIKALFSMTQIKDISFRLACTKPPEDPDWTASLIVDGKGSGLYDADFCLFLENWMNKLAALQSGSISDSQYEKWQRETLKYYSESYFSDTAPDTDKMSSN
jgi:transcriptional regulator with XRE-family HTH domain